MKGLQPPPGDGMTLYADTRKYEGWMIPVDDDYPYPSFNPPAPRAPSPQPGPSTPPEKRRVLSPRPFVDGKGEQLVYRTFREEDTDLPAIKRLCEQELSEPYNVYTFRYFLQDWPHLTFFVFPSADAAEPIATCICKLDKHREQRMRGYIGMLSVDKQWRRRGIARKLAELAIKQMFDEGAHEIALETEYDNVPSLALYEALGFVREKRLHRFYSNGKDAYRLLLISEDNGSFMRGVNFIERAYNRSTGAEKEMEMKKRMDELELERRLKDEAEYGQDTPDEPDQQRQEVAEENQESRPDTESPDYRRSYLRYHIPLGTRKEPFPKSFPDDVPPEIAFILEGPKDLTATIARMKEAPW